MAKPITILVADDDADDRLLINDAFEENKLNNPLHYVNDGEELMDYLHRRGQYGSLKGEPYPGVVLLDLNMPKKDGRAALSPRPGGDQEQPRPAVHPGRGPHDIEGR